jgi:hypothetical protein
MKYASSTIAPSNPPAVNDQVNAQAVPKMLSISRRAMELANELQILISRTAGETKAAVESAAKSMREAEKTIDGALRRRENF